MRSMILSVIALMPLSVLQQTTVVETPPPTSEADSDDDVIIQDDAFGNAITVWGTGGITTPDSGASAASSSSRVVVPPELIAMTPALGAGADGTKCYVVAPQVLDTAQAAASATAAARAHRGLDGALPDCPAEPGGMQVPPELVALSFWERADLPVPDPWMAPGWALTGKRAYLEANSSLTAHFEYDTPFGLLVIDAYAEELVVDWGDGSGWETYYSLGGPWPDGDIIHIYADKGSVDITAAQNWSATWTLAGASGALDGMQTIGTIDDFQLRELEAVLG